MPRIDTFTADAENPDTAQHRTVVPASIPMVSLLGSADAMLRVVEELVPDVDVHVRGNEITVTGPADEVVLAERLVDEMVTVVRTGQGLTEETVRRSAQMLRARTTERPADVLTFSILSHRGRTIRPKTLNQKRYVDAIDAHTLTFGIGPAGTGKTYLAVAKAVQALQSQRGHPHRADPPGGRGGRAAGVPARHAHGEDRPLPAAALRRPARHARPATDPAADDRAAPSRSPRWPTCAAAR